MVLNEKGVDNQVAMRFDARNKESKYFNFDMVAQGADAIDADLDHIARHEP